MKIMLFKMTENYIVLVPNQTIMLMLKYSYAFMLLLLQLAIFLSVLRNWLHQERVKRFMLTVCEFDMVGFICL